MPPHSPEQMHKQWEASAKFMRDNAKCHKHNEYDMVNPPEGNCNHCWNAYCERHGTKEAVTLFHQAMEKYGEMQG